MIFRHKYSFGYFIFLQLFFIGCAKKPRSIIPADEIKQDIVFVKPTRLELPVVKNVSIEKIDEILLLKWAKIDEHVLNSERFLDLAFVGYNVYTFSKFVLKSPINSLPLKDCFYEDKSLKNSVNKFYLVRSIFGYKNIIFEGPSSKIVCL